MANNRQGTSKPKNRPYTIEELIMNAREFMREHSHGEISVRIHNHQIGGIKMRPEHNAKRINPKAST